MTNGVLTNAFSFACNGTAFVNNTCVQASVGCPSQNVVSNYTEGFAETDCRLACDSGLVNNSGACMSTCSNI